MSIFGFTSPTLIDLEKRGFLYQVTDSKGLDQLFQDISNVIFYIGYDPTARSLHAGHLLWIKFVEKLQKAGAKPIILTGGATSKIGDPTWKDKERVALDPETVLENSTAIEQRLRSFVKFGDAHCEATLLNNNDWISRINYMDFLRDFGPLFSVNKMLTMDSVSARLERQQHLSFLEFNYMLLQAYDFLHLFVNYGCNLQIGGADQWSNMISGVDLVRRRAGKLAFGVSMPLLTNSSGQKMGKTESGTIWLDEELTSPFEFWQYWRNVDDRDVTKLLKIFSDIDIAKVETYDSFIGMKKMNDLKIILADTLTKFVHPTADLLSIRETTRGLFDRQKCNMNDIKTFDIDVNTRIDRVLFTTKLAPSLTAARRLIDGKGVKIDDEVVTACDSTIVDDCLISVGRKKFIKIKVKD
ncbi:MAG: tyrosine--tRNA ligase [Holosporales bacterium]|jgi:tyrosyl-tRNA synthetase|nr:tyrosine--tRNA ligase [Holosporales bacterium]